jgi:hypothetical protein
MLGEERPEEKPDVDCCVGGLMAPVETTLSFLRPP